MASRIDSGAQLARLIAGTAALLAGQTALAQSVPPPRAVQVAPPTRSDVERVPPPREQKYPTRLTVSGGIERSACALDQPRFAEVTVALTKVVFTGLGPVDPATLDGSWRPLVGQKLPVGTLCEMRDAAATLLRRQGYLAAVQVPPQRIEGGVVRFDVLMAKLVAIHVRGNAGHAERRIAALLEPLKRDAAFNEKTAERALLLASDLPGFDVHLTLRSAGTAPGEVIGDVTVARTGFAADLNVQNYGSSAVGPVSGLATLAVNDILGLGDRLELGLYNTSTLREQTVVQGSYELRPGSSGLVLAARGTYAHTDPSIGNGDPVRAETLIGTLEAGYPLLRRQRLTLRAAAGIDIVGQKVRFAGLPLTDDQLRMAYVRLEADASDPSLLFEAPEARGPSRWRVTGALELRQGIGGLGASHGCGPAPLYAACTAAPSISRLDADPQATLLRASGTATFQLTRRLGLVLSPRVQVAFEPLLSFEQFSAGNYTVGRGYDPGALNGDNGFGQQVELRYGPIALSRARGLGIQPFAFVDAARVWTLGPIPGIYRTESILTAGGGARVALATLASAELILAAPIGQTPLPDQDRGLRALFSVTTHLTAGQ